MKKLLALALALLSPFVVLGGYSYAEVDVTIQPAGYGSYSLQWEYFYGGSWTGQAASAAFSGNGVKTIYSPGHGEPGVPCRLVLVMSGTRGTAYEIGTRVGSSDSAFYGTLNITGINVGTWTGSATGVTPPVAAPWKLSQPIVNNTLVRRCYSYSMTGSLGTVRSGTFCLEPGQTYTLNIELPAGEDPGALSFVLQEFNSDGGVTRETSVTVPPSDPAWQQTAGTPTTGAGTTAPAPAIPTDSTSKTSPGISFNAGASAAKDETLQTGFGAVRRAVAEGASQAHADAVAIEKAIKDSRPGTPDNSALSSSATSGGTAASSSTASAITGYGSGIAGVSSAVPTVSTAGVWAFAIPGTSYSLDFNPFSIPAFVNSAAVVRSVVSWLLWLGTAWFAWKEAKATFEAIGSVKAAGAASTVPVVSSGTALVMAGIITAACLAIPAALLAWMASTGALANITGGLTAALAGADSLIYKFITVVEAIVPLSLMIYHLLLRWVFSATVGGVYAVSSSIVRFAVG